MTSLLSHSASRSLSCHSCGGNVAVDFGPHGFLATCGRCGQDEHLDDMMEPVRPRRKVPARTAVKQMVIASLAVASS